MDNYIKNINNKNFKVNVYKSPWAAAIWSACLPGFGQFYNRDYIVALTLGIWEVLVNLMSGLNWSIYYSFIGDLEKSFTVIDWGWGLYYPSVYAFNIWHAYDRAKVINLELEKRGVPKPEKHANGLGFFTGLFLGMFFGIHWTFLKSPVFSGVILGLILGIAGYFIEKILSKSNKQG